MKDEAGLPFNTLRGNKIPDAEALGLALLIVVLTIKAYCKKKRPADARR